jgi:NADPH-dependent glutamate synthase beta subunit-like oxidoreductase/NAD-dependent dihydropyrimidine dehydrogenase PreA subunit
MGRGVVITGSGVPAAQCALSLAGMGIQATIVTALSSLNIENELLPDNCGLSSAAPYLRPLLLRAATHPLIKICTQSRVEAVSGVSGNLLVEISGQPRFIRPELCTSCGLCERECPVKINRNINGRTVSYNAVHAPHPDASAIPSTFLIEKQGIAACRTGCPLGINVQGFVSLLARGKIDQAVKIINEAAPLAGVLGRLCTHPCETGCERQKIDNPLYIQALHRYAADHANKKEYAVKAPSGSHKDKVAIIGSGPAGLAATWELARRGYTPVIFESSSEPGGVLATGIPRFRLPREVLHKEIEAIKALGVEIKTGVSIGKDITCSDLMQQGYQAICIAVGAQKNNRLNIPGEDLKGIWDSLELLDLLNSGTVSEAGENVVVIGGGNSAVDSARTIRRISRGTVRLLCITPEMTAAGEEVQEALKEGISIDYLVQPLEILGDNGRVTGIRCRRVKKVEFDSGGSPVVEPEPDSVFIIDVDQVVVSIGQKPGTAGLHIPGLDIVADRDTVKVDRLTLVTSIPGYFAAGDCITGSNNVVESMASGIHAAESIDRYLTGRNLEENRTLEKLRPVEVDIEQMQFSPHKRSRMPSTPISRRTGSFNETNLGFSGITATSEAERCLNCGLCSECRECEQVCGAGAVFHDEEICRMELSAARVIQFEKGGTTLSSSSGIYRITEKTGGDIVSQLTQASAVAIEVGLSISPFYEAGRISGPRIIKAIPVREKRIGVILCRCGDSISSVLDFDYIRSKVQELPQVYTVKEISQACTPEGASQISTCRMDDDLTHMVVAACRCCNLEQICFSCSDRRIMCRENLSCGTSTSGETEFVNIREQCAWIYSASPSIATSRALEIITSGVARISERITVVPEARTLNPGVLVISTGEAGIETARILSLQGYSVTLVSKKEESLVPQSSSVRQIPWPEQVELGGCPGSYEAALKSNSGITRVKAGALVFCLSEDYLSKGGLLVDNFLGHLVSRTASREEAKTAVFRGITGPVTSGIFIIPDAGEQSIEEQTMSGAVFAGQVSIYLAQETVNPRASAVVIEPRLCRGCGDCAALCPYIEMKAGKQCGESRAYIDPAFCLGCGACIASCPTGAISQPSQSDREIIAGLEAVLGKVAG